MPLASIATWLAICALPGLFATPAAALALGMLAPEIDLPALDGGGPITLHGLRGRVVVVDFWGTWCPCCAQQIPFLDRLARTHAEAGLTVIGVSEDGTDGSVRGFVERSGARFPVARDTDHRVARRYEPRDMPTTFIVDRRGVVRHIHEGFRAEDATRIENEVRALLAEAP